MKGPCRSQLLSFKAQNAPETSHGKEERPPYEDEIMSVEGPDARRGGPKGTAPDIPSYSDG